MSDHYTFIITILVEAWKQGEDVFGPSLIRWILEVKIEDVDDGFGWDGKKVLKKLVEKQPQLKGKKVLEIEETNITIA